MAIINYGGVIASPLLTVLDRMRQHNKYLQKVQDELSVFQRYLLDESVALTPTQQETYDNIDTVRALLRDGRSDAQALTVLKQQKGIQERRSREILALAYAVFAELRAARAKEGVKYLYAEIFRNAAFDAKEKGDLLSFGILMEKAAKIDGAYDNQKVLDVEDKKKPTKVIFKIKTVNVGGGNERPQIEDATHEIVG